MKFAMKKLNSKKKHSISKDKNTERISKKNYNKELEEAIARIDKGDFVTHKSALKELSKW